jgi:hypothetical protein
LTSVSAIEGAAPATITGIARTAAQSAFLKFISILSLEFVVAPGAVYKDILPEWEMNGPIGFRSWQTASVGPKDA